jgi:signal peptidase II
MGGVGVPRRTPRVNKPVITMPEATHQNLATRTRDTRPALLILTAVVILLDRLSKIWIIGHIRPGSAITVIPSVFRITHVLNTGAAFSLLENLPPDAVRLGLIAFSAVAVLIVFTMLWRTGRALTLTSVALALILGGALGNLYDRIRFHHVVDFLEVRIIHYHWPDFNIADSAIVVGACLLFIEIFRPQPGDEEVHRAATDGRSGL